MSGFALVVSNSLFPLVPPHIIDSQPEDGSDIPLPLARQLAVQFLQQYISANSFQGKNVRRALLEASTLEPHHYVSLETLRIELRPRGLVLQ